jgi:hypothetical protein
MVAYVKTPADAVGITDAVAKGRTLGPVNDAVGITDSAKVTVGRPRNDPIGITDSRTVLQATVRNPADNVGIRDSVTALLVEPPAFGAYTPPRMRLRIYAPDGPDQGLLPVSGTATVTYTLDDVGALKFNYSTRAPRVSALGQPCEIAVELSKDGGTSWFERTDSRFVYLTDGANPLDSPDSFNIDAKSYVWRMSKAIVFPNGLLNADGKRAFLLSNGANAGVVLKTLLNEASARGWAPGFDHSSFSTIYDSAGKPWSQGFTIYYTPGLDYLTIIRNLADQGFIDWQMQGRKLHVYNADTVLATDRTLSTTAPVTFRAGRDINEAPFTRTWEGLADTAYFAGDKVDRTYTNPLAITPWGRQEMFISNGSVSDPGTIDALIQANLSQTDLERTEYTSGLNFKRATAAPMFHYQPGDWVWRTVDGALPTKLRLVQVTLTSSSKGVLSGNVVLNDRFLEADVRAVRRVQGITNGASGDAAIPGSGTVGGANAIPPAQVGGLIGSSLAYDGPGGFPQAQVSLSWNAVTTNSDGTPITDLDHYEIWQRKPTEDISKRHLEAQTTSTSVDLSPYQTGSDWLFTVRAVDQIGNRGNFAVETAVTMASDTVPPQQPSTPTAATTVGIIRLTWDGSPATGSWPADFDYVEVHVSTINDFVPDTTTLFERMYGEGVVPYAAGSYGTPYFFKLIAVDKTGLKGPPSAQATAAPARLVGTDIDVGAITYEQIGFKDPGNVITDGSFESPTYQATLLSRSSAAWQFTTADKFHGDTSATIDCVVDSATTRDLVLMSSAEAQQIIATDKLFCRFAYKGTAGATGRLFLIVEWIDATGTTTTSNLEGTIKNGAWQQIAGQLTAPAGVESFRIYVRLDNGGTVGNYWVDAVEVRRTVGTSIIQDAAITNALIANLAVDNAKIASLDVGKITAGTLMADVLIGSTIRTASSGARVELTGTGIRLYDGSNAVKAHMDPSTGQLRIFSTADLSHTSVAHGLQVGLSTSTNLAFDDNEIMSRDNGSYGDLFINREGGHVYIGGIQGGFNPDESDWGLFPANYDHYFTIRAFTNVWDFSAGDYADEFPPFSVGDLAGLHLWMDRNHIAATNGDAVSTLYLQPPYIGGTNHTTSVSMASNQIFVEALTTGGSNSGIRGASAADVGIQFYNGQALIRTDGWLAYQPIVAQAFTLSSQRSLKHDITDIDPLALVEDAPSTMWKYDDEIETSDHWHIGPMADDLPAELRRVVKGEEDNDGHMGLDLATIAGIAWEGVRQLSKRQRQLNARIKALETKAGI